MDHRVVEAMVDVMRGEPANASSLHQSGRLAGERIDQAVQTIGQCLGVRLDQPGGPRLVLTSGGTESNNLAINGVCPEGALAVSRVEHPSVRMAAAAAQQAGRTVHWIDVDRNGVVSLDSLGKILDDSNDPPSLVSVLSANNETGVTEPTEAIAAQCRSHGVALHVDATQTVGKLPVNLESWGCAAATFTAHKFHGPAGIGGLYLAPGVSLQPMMHGGEQQLQSRPGTEPVALIVGMALALEIAINEQPSSLKHTRTLRNRLENALLERFPSWIAQGSAVDRLPQTSCLSMIGSDRQSMLMALDLAGIDCSSGSACSSGSSPPSHVLQAMGCCEAEIGSVIRFGVSKFSTEREINESIERISNCFNKLRR